MPKILAKDMCVKLSGRRIFGSETILSNVNFEIKDGDRLALIGPNGAGKSTLMQTLAGILEPSSGMLEIEGEINALFNVGLGTRKESTGRRNMLLRNMVQGRSYKEVKDKLPEMIDFADIGEYIDRPMEIYSQGMAMRCVFAAATAFDPDILLMDEWLGAGDAGFREKSAKRMEELVEKSGMLVLATHHQRLSRDMCNLGLYLKKGNVAFFGDVGEAWDRYIEEGLRKED
ncbi:ABC transporter ATP-binding protein [Ponticaulis profundi]|uniref:ABC transporter ATP-binding protein n=1 Tax=Ponticaulis profundi TaxID=2665222 RepID=A0ABW1SEK2_9PROT